MPGYIVTTPAITSCKLYNCLMASRVNYITLRMVKGSSVELDNQLSQISTKPESSGYGSSGPLTGAGV
jgi:hypothetical protein